MRYYPGLSLDSQELTPEFLRAQDCIVVVTDHTAYDFPAIVRDARLVADTRNATRTVPAGKCVIVKA